MARLIDEGMIAQLSKKQGYFLKYFPARIRNVGEDAKEDRKLIYAFKDARTILSIRNVTSEKKRQE